MANMNNASVRAADLIRRLKYELKYDPLEELVKLSRKDDVKDEMKKSIHCSILPYMYHTLKAIDLDMGTQQPIVLNLDLSGSLKGAEAQQKLLRLTTEEFEDTENEEREAA